MAVIWTGPWSTADVPAGQRFTGWSNHTTGNTTFKNRYRDGDPVSAAMWRELAGNLNYNYAQSRRLIWEDSFIGTGVASADPTKVNIGNDWTARAAIYAVAGPFVMTPNAIRGDEEPPRLVCRVRARRNGGAASLGVRIYSVSTFNSFLGGWAQVDGASSGPTRAAWTIASNSYPGSPGWSAEATITAPKYARQIWSHPLAAGLPDVEVMATYLAIAGIGDTVNGPLVAAVQVWEEAPGA